MGKIEIRSYKGDVVDVQRHGQTEVHSSGGGGYVGPYGGRVHAPVISSTSTTVTELFVKDSQNKEIHFKINGAEFPVRIGHSVTILAAFLSNSKNGYLVAGVNHNTEKTHYLMNDEVLRDLKVIKSPIQYSRSILVLVLISCFTLPLGLYTSFSIMGEEFSAKNFPQIIATVFIIKVILLIIVKTLRDRSNITAATKFVERINNTSSL